MSDTVLHIGFTGTREGMSRDQQIRVGLVLKELYKPGSHFHHGDCIGADAEAHAMADALDYEIHIHPPIDGKHRASVGAVELDHFYEPKSHFARNRDIVDACNILIVAPLVDHWCERGGTWYTHDYAVKRHKTIVVCWRDGRILLGAAQRIQATEQIGRKESAA